MNSDEITEGGLDYVDFHITENAMLDHMTGYRRWSDYVEELAVEVEDGKLVKPEVMRVALRSFYEDLAKGIALSDAERTAALFVWLLTIDEVPS